MAKTWVLVAAILGSSMSFIDGSAVGVVLPILQADLGANAAEVSWVVEGYSLFLSALMLLGGSLGDIFGRKRTFALGIAIFLVASLGCALAPTVGVLVVSRCMQGIGGALAMPGSLALISSAYEGEARGRAIGTWSGFASMTAAAGPVIGGALAQHFSWRLVFLINVPLALAVIAIAVCFIEETRDEGASPEVDYAGAALATLGLGLLIFGLIRLQNERQDSFAAATALLGVLILMGFVVVEGRARHPMMPVELFASKTFSAANLYTLLVYATLGGSLYFLPFTLIDVQRYSPTAAGAAFLPFVIIQFISSPWSGGLVSRIGPRAPLVLGAVLAAAGYVLYAIPPIGASYWTSYFPATVVLGIGGAFFVAPLTTTVLDAVARAHSGIASGINNAVARSGGLIAIAALGIVLVAAFDRNFDARLAHENLSVQTRTVARTQIVKLAAGTVPPEIPPGDRERVEAALRESFMAGFRRVMYLSAIVCLAAGAVAFAGIPAKPIHA